MGTTILLSIFRRGRLGGSGRAGADHSHLSFVLGKILELLVDSMVGRHGLGKILDLFELVDRHGLDKIPDLLELVDRLGFGKMLKLVELVGLGKGTLDRMLVEVEAG